MGRVLREFRSRLWLNVPDELLKARVRKMLSHSYNHWGTLQYEKFQEGSNGLAPMGR